MQLVEAKKLRLDDKVQQYFPWLRIKPAQMMNKLTIRHLLHHTSGISRTAPIAGGKNPTLREHVQALSGQRLHTSPGQRHHYASPNYQILGLLVEKLSGLSFGAYIQKYIFRPLAMHRSFVEQSRALKKGMSSGHRYWFGFGCQFCFVMNEGAAPPLH